MQTLEEKIEHSIGLIKKYEDDAMRLNGGYTVCFSGGKDSQVLLDLFKSVFEWWISKQSAEKFFTQLKLNFD